MCDLKTIRVRFEQNISALAGGGEGKCIKSLPLARSARLLHLFAFLGRRLDILSDGLILQVFERFSLALMMLYIRISSVLRHH